MIEAWLTDRSGHRVRIVVPKRGEKRGLLDLAARNAQVAYQTRFNENVAAHYDALETLRAVLNLPSIPRRIECFDISTIQGSETVASMVVCEDGRMKRAEYRKFESEVASRTRSGGIERSPTDRTDPTSHPRRLRLDARGRAAALSEGARERRALSGPDRHRRRQGAAVGGVCGARGARAANLVAVGIAKKEELLFTREHVEPHGAGAEQSRRCC